jgi:hypothetical protein
MLSLKAKAYLYFAVAMAQLTNHAPMSLMDV